MLSIVDQECLDLFTNSVRSHYPDARAWAFGSRVRGEEDADSDLDICVVLEDMDWETRRKISDIAWEIGFERDRARMQLRREAVDLSLAAAAKLLEAKLDSEADRRLVTEFLESAEKGQ